VGEIARKKKHKKIKREREIPVTLNSIGAFPDNTTLDSQL